MDSDEAKGIAICCQLFEVLTASVVGHHERMQHYAHHDPLRADTMHAHNCLFAFANV